MMKQTFSQEIWNFCCPVRQRSGCLAGHVQ